MKTAAGVREAPAGECCAAGRAAVARLPARPAGFSAGERNPGLTIGRSDDPAEREADALADQALLGLPLLRPGRASAAVRRMCAECEDEEKKTVRRKATGGDALGGMRAPAAVSRLLANPGRALDPSTRRYFEGRFERSFANVSVHDGVAADEAARSIEARAFTAGSSIVFARGQYSPGTDAGRRLLAHELAHVVQGGAPVVRRDKAGSDPLLSVTLALVRNTPPTFRATFQFEKSSESFEVKLMTGTKTLTGIRESTQTLSASPYYHHEGEQVPKAGAVLFTLPDEDDAYLWFSTTKENMEILLRANTYLQRNDPVTLSIIDETKPATVAPADKSGGAGKAGEKGEKGGAPAPKYIDAEAWLAKEMLPQVKAALAADFPSVQAGTLIPYRSVAIQKSEPDISLIQVNRPGSKAIAGHVRVDRRKWVGQEGPARKRYAGEVASAIASRLTEAARKERLGELDAQNAKKSAGEAFPAWAIKLRDEVERKLDEIRKAALPGPAPPDIPDRINLAHVGTIVHFQLFIERKDAISSDKPLWQSAIMSPWIEESQAEDIDGLVRLVREQTALMRSMKVKAAEPKDDVPISILMPAIPADIQGKNLSRDGTTVTHATNRFEMSVRIDLSFSMVGGRDLWNMVGYSMRLGLDRIPIQWKVAPFTQYNAEDLVRVPAKAPKGTAPMAKGDLYFDLANPAIDQGTKIQLANRLVDKAAIMASPAYPLADTTEGVLDDLDYEFPGIPGVYLVVAETRPPPLVNEKYKQIFPPSRAILPVRVMRPRDLAQESVSQNLEAIAAKEKAAADPDLTEAEKLKVEADLAKLKALEGMNQLGVVRAAEKDIDRDIRRYTELRSWLIDDHKKHPSIRGSATEDPLLTRLSTWDLVHDSHLFETFMDIYKEFGDHAFDTSYLDEPPDSKNGQIHVLNQKLALLAEQKKESRKLQTTIMGLEGEFKQDDKGNAITTQTVATLVLSKTGNKIPLLLLVGETPDSIEGAWRYKIIDLTLSSTKLFNAKKQTFAPSFSHGSREGALFDAFVNFGEDNSYDEGTIFYRFAGEPHIREVPNIKTVAEHAEEIAQFVAILGMIATVAFSGGATAPAVAAVIGAITLANAALAIYLSSRNLARRSAAGTLEFDAEAALDVLNIVASVIGLGALARGRQLAQAASAARSTGNLARAAAAMAKIEQLGRNMLVVDTAVLGGTAVLTGWRVAEDVARVKMLHLPPDEEAELMREVAADAVMQGAMLAFQTAVLAKSHWDMYSEHFEKNRYQSFEERGWVDSDGHVTDQAPPRLKAAAKGEAPPVSEKPPVSLESDLPRVKQAKGKAKRLTSDPEHDIEIPFTDEHGEPHSFKRRREDGTWCRYSNPYCFIRDEDIERIVDEIGAFDEEPGVGAGAPKAVPKGGKGVPGKSWGRLGREGRTMTRTIQDTIARAMADLKAALGKAWLLPHIYGTKLHKVAADLFRGMKLPTGWRALIDQPLKKSGLLDPAFAKMTVREFLEEHAPWLIPGKYEGPFVDPAKSKYTTGVPDSLLEKKLGDIEPDLILVAPDGTKIVWDLAPSENAEHMAKTLVYALAIDSQGGRVQIGETYYHPERGLEIDSGRQAQFRGKAAEAQGRRITLDDGAARSLARKNFGKGKPILPDLPADRKLRAKVLAGRKKPGGSNPLPAGNQGSIELIKGDTVIGEWFDPRSKTWVETKNYSIHYHESGVFIRPEAP